MSEKYYKYTALIAIFAACVFAILALVAYIRHDLVSTSSNGEKILRIDSSVGAIMECYRRVLPGMMLAVNKDGKTFHTAGYGYADPSKKVKVNVNTAFGIASITKSFTAVLALKTLNENKLDRDAKVADILSSLNFRFEDDLLTQQETVGDLLSHRTGIPGYNFIRFQSHYNRDAIVRDMAYLNKTDGYRDSYLYSNIGYGLAAKVTEMLDAKKRTWEDMLTEEIFRPLGMNDTFLRAQPGDRNNVAVPHMYTDSGNYKPVSTKFLRHWGSIGASGSVMMSAVDASRWLHFLMSGGQTLDGRQVVSRDVMATLVKPVVASEWHIHYPIKPDAPQTFISTGYASGLRFGTYRGYKLLMHTGSTYGYTSIMIMVPSKNASVFITFNGYDRYYKARLPLALHVLDILMDEKPWLDKISLCSFPEPWSPARKDTSNKYKHARPQKATRPLSEYVGHFGTNAFGNITVVLDRTSTRLLLTYGVYTGSLHPEKQPDHFSLVGEGDTWFLSATGMSFLDDNGALNAIKMTLFSSKNPPVFYKL